MAGRGLFGGYLAAVALHFSAANIIYLARVQFSLDILRPSCCSQKSPTMPRVSKAKQSRTQNLPKPPREPETRGATVMDAMFSDDGDEDWMPELSDVSDSEREDDESDEEDDVGDWSDLEGDNSEEDIKAESKLLLFSTKMQNFLQAHIKKVKDGNKKRKAPYNGSSERNKRRKKAQGRAMEAKGFPSVFSFFQKKSVDGTSPDIEAASTVDSDSIPDLEEIPAHVSQFLSVLFKFSPKDEQVFANSTAWAGTNTEEVNSSAANRQQDADDSESEGCTETVVISDDNALLDMWGEEISAVTEKLEQEKSYIRKDEPQLHDALTKLATKSKDKKIDVFFRARLSAMCAGLRLFLDETLGYTWRHATQLASTAAGHGIKYARKLRTWILTFVREAKLPFSRYGRMNTSLLEDEDFSQAIQLHLQSIAKDGYIRAQDVVDFVNRDEMKKFMGSKKGITVQTARRWMKSLKWRFGKKKRGMYIDGHEREDVVAYRREMLERFAGYQKDMVQYGRDGDPVFGPKESDSPRLILVTHDESTFYANDRRKTKWTHASDKAEPEKKGEGVSIMISDYLTPDWGRLTSSEGRVLFH